MVSVSERKDGLIELRCDTLNIVFSEMEKVLWCSLCWLVHASNPLLNCLAMYFIVWLGPSTSSSALPESLSETVWITLSD